MSKVYGVVRAMVLARLDRGIRVRCEDAPPGQKRSLGRLRALARMLGHFASLLFLVVLTCAGADVPNVPQLNAWPTVDDQKYYHHEFEFQRGPELQCDDGWGVDPTTGCSRVVGRV
jgi:hypothetical protein